MNHVKSEHDIMGKTKIQLLYLLNPNFIALFALHVLCNIKTAMKSISTNPFLITGYQGPDYFCDREKETASLMSALKNGKNITLSGVGSTRMMGPQDLMEKESKYLSALGNVTGFEFKDNNTLVLKAGADTLTFTKVK